MCCDKMNEGTKYKTVHWQVISRSYLFRSPHRNQCLYFPSTYFIAIILPHKLTLQLWLLTNSSPQCLTANIRNVPNYLGGGLQVLILKENIDYAKQITVAYFPKLEKGVTWLLGKLTTGTFRLLGTHLLWDVISYGWFGFNPYHVY